MHKHDILHRDLKPGNCFLTKSNIIKIGDFGAAKKILSPYTSLDTRIGTPSYMAPEIMFGENYSKNVDIWSLGITLYELLTLERPF